MFELPPPVSMLAIAIVIFLAIGLHEYSHAKFADMAGDPTPRYFGRVTLNLTKHFELVGTLMIAITSIAGVGIGWGKPVPMDPRKMRNPRWDHFVAVLAGPVSNVAQAVVYALLWRLFIPPQELAQLGENWFGLVMRGEAGFIPALLLYGMLINLSLCFFNLLPLGPLDGMWILGTFLSDRVRHAWTRWNLTVGQFVFLGAVILSQLTPFDIVGTVILPPLLFVLRLLIGGIAFG